MDVTCVYLYCGNSKQIGQHNLIIIISYRVFVQYSITFHVLAHSLHFSQLTHFILGISLQLHTMELLQCCSSGATTP